jgi:hypothetical protein
VEAVARLDEAREDADPPIGGERLVEFRQHVVWSLTCHHMLLSREWMRR